MHAPSGRRRFQWLFVRIEVELRKIQGQRPELGTLVPQAAPGDAGGAHPLAPHPHDDGGSGSEEEGMPLRGAAGHAAAAAAQRGGKEKKGGGGSAAARMVGLVDLNPPPSR